jgi:hypothetical protein
MGPMSTDDGKLWITFNGVSSRVRSTSRLRHCCPDTSSRRRAIVEDAPADGNVQHVES